MVAFKKKLREEFKTHALDMRSIRQSGMRVKGGRKDGEGLSKLKRKTMMDRELERDAVRILRHIGSDDSNKRATERRQFFCSLYF